ncbi:hypothetical protein HYV81_00705 [Candidatus Woesearchaeota archaeon]|nr:hypothetical protein [Candidatus Woesearchaeota archaeon]
MGKRGQVSFEYIVIAGILLVITLPFFYYAFSESNTAIKLNQADDAVKSIARAADTVYSLGPGSKLFVVVSIPDGVQNTSITSKTVQLQLSIYGGVSDIYANTKANLTGSIPTARGTYKLSLEMLNSGLVAIGAFNDTTVPSVIWTSPSGTQVSNDTTLQANTNKAGYCKFASSDMAFSSMTNIMSGYSLSHSYYLGQLAEGDYIYYVRCNDTSGNVMDSSAIIDFSINVTSDTIAPNVSNTKIENSSVKLNDYVCVNATITDNGAISAAKVMFTTPLEDPFQKVQNYTMSDTGNCSGASGDNIYGVKVKMQVVGLWYLNITYGIDDDGNVGQEIVSATSNITIRVNESSTINGTNTSITYNALNYSAVDIGLYFSSSPNATKNQSSVSTTDVTEDLIDDSRTTPSSSYKFKVNQVNYEGFILQINKSPSPYSKVVVRIKFDSADILPYNLTAWGYLPDGDRLQMNFSQNFSVTHVRNINLRDRGDNEFDVTNLMKNAGYNKIKIRLAPTVQMDGKRADITEADIGIS